MVFFLKQLVTHYQIVQEKDTAYVVNIAGRQRMLSQKIVKNLAFIEANDLSSNKEIYIEDLDKSLELWKKSHTELLEINQRKGFFNKNAEIQKMFEEMEPSFLKLVVAAEDILQAATRGQDNEEQLGVEMDEIIENEAIFLEKMDSTVYLYERDFEKSLQVIWITHLALFLLIIVILIFFASMIFFPMFNYLKNAFWKMNESNANIMKIFHTMKSPLFVIKRDGEILFMNADAEKLISNEGKVKEGLDLEKSINWMEFDILGLIQKVKKDNIRIENIEATIANQAGKLITVMISAVAGTYYRSEVVILNLFDVTVQKEAEQVLKNIAKTDELTGLYNHHFLEQMIDQEFERSRRYKIPISVFLLDLDYFKKINDKWRHPVGDSVLKFTADIIKNNIRQSDYPIRIGGEEFLVMMLNTDAQGAVEVAEKIRKTIEETSHPIIGSLTASFGVAERAFDEDYESLYKRVDQGLYQAKKSGRNCVRLVE